MPNPLRLCAFLAFLAAFLGGFGWLIDISLSRTVGLIALGLLLEVLASVPLVPVSS